MLDYFTRHHYHWRGQNRHLKPMSGTIAATSMEVAKLKLSQQKIINIEITKASLYRLLQKVERPLTNDVYINLLRQLASLLQAGIPLHQCCDIILTGTSDKRLKRVMQQIMNYLAEGQSLAESIRHLPQIFNPLTCHLIAIGEKTGSLNARISQAANHHEQAQRLRSRMWQVLTYPVAVSILACLITISMLLWVVPQFADFFGGFQGTLPRSTQFVLNLSYYLRAYVFYLPALIFIIALIFILLKQKLRQSNFCQQYLFSVPKIGQQIRKFYLIDFATSLSVMLKAGLPIAESCHFLIEETKNYYVRASLRRLHESLLVGRGIFQSVLENSFFTEQAKQMIKVGEETGCIDQILAQLAEIYQEELTAKIDRFSRLIEPLIIVILGALIGGLVIALYLPIFTLGNVI